MYSTRLKALQKCIENFKQYSKMSKEEARIQQSFPQCYNELLSNLSQQEFTNKKLINFGEKIERQVLYYLAAEEKQYVCQLLSNIYFHNLDMSNPKQLAVSIQYLGHVNKIMCQVLKNKLDQQDLYEIIKVINEKNAWSQLHQEYIDTIKKRLEEVQSQDLELDSSLFNQLIIASQSIDIEIKIRRILKSEKVKKIYKTEDNFTTLHLDIINRIIGDAYISITNWQLYQQEILKLPFTTLSQQQFVYDHLQRYYQLTKENNETITHPGVVSRQANIYVNYILLQMSNNIGNLNSLDLGFEISNCNLDGFCKINKQLVNLTYSKLNDTFLYKYLSSLQQELNVFINNNGYQESEKLNQYIRLLESLNGFHELKLHKKQTDPIDEIYSIIEEVIFKLICKNHYEIELDGDQDPFAADLLKYNKIKVGKWKEEENQIKIHISTEETIQYSTQLLQLAELFTANFQGKLYFHYALVKLLSNSFQSLSFSQQCDLLYYLTKIDKTFMIDESKFKIDYSQLQLTIGQEQLKCTIQLLFYNEITFNIEKNNISSLIDIIHQNFDLLCNLSKQLQATLLVSYKIMQIEFPLIETRTLPDELINTFEQHWLFLQNQKEVLVQDTKKYLDQEQYHYISEEKVDIWKFLFVFEENKTVVLCLSKRFYLGKTNLNLIEVSILKRVLRLLDYKLRILDRHEYSKLGTRQEKNTYIYEKLRHLNREPKKPKVPYFNY